MNHLHLLLKMLKCWLLSDPFFPLVSNMTAIFIWNLRELTTVLLALGVEESGVLGSVRHLSVREMGCTLYFSGPLHISISKHFTHVRGHLPKGEKIGMCPSFYFCLSHVEKSWRFCFNSLPFGEVLLVPSCEFRFCLSWKTAGLENLWSDITRAKRGQSWAGRCFLSAPSLNLSQFPFDTHLCSMTKTHFGESSLC